MQSEQVNEIFIALCKAQSEIEIAIKDSNNPFFKSKYADISSVWKACRNALSKNNICISQVVEYRDGISFLSTLMGHSSGQWIKSSCPILARDNSPQAFGSAITYARRYSLAAIAGVIADDDDDGEAAMARSKNKIDSEQIKELTLLSEQLPPDRLNGFNNWVKSIGYDSIFDVEVKTFPAVLSTLKRSVEAEKKAK